MFYKKANKTIEEDLACFDRNRFRNKRLKKLVMHESSYTLTKKDKDVLRAFSDKNAASSKHLDTDGNVLNKVGLGGNDFAKWKGNKIFIDPDRPHVKSDEVIIRALKKIVPKNWIIHESSTLKGMHDMNGYRQIRRLLEGSGRLNESRSSLYVRFTRSRDPMSNWGHAMFVEGDKIDDVAYSYGDNLWVYDGKKGIDISRISKQVWIDWRNDIENEEMDYVLGRSLENISKSMFLESINPDGIVGDAGLWDNREFISWFWDRYEYPAVVTYDGAIVFDRKLIRKPTDRDYNKLDWDPDDDFL